MTSPHGLLMARLYFAVVVAIVAALAVESCREREPEPAQPRVTALSVSGVPPTTTELGARIDMLELRMESRDDAIEALLWLAEQDRKGCRSGNP